ncbi:hypothetical protein [Geminicoccus roseus]|uniref:hypothetical protein n=1 Tax=Geminicoccus roseus TaxID=404900 RepID=UPI0003FED8B4|nr:hypothetical protein [Geminicoccus roseus]
MSRRLGPEETKYWLLGQAQPFNIVLAAGIAGWRPPVALALPGIELARGLPRWTAASPEGRIETATGPWPAVAQDLLRAPLPAAGGGAWRLALVDDGMETVLLLALPHALVDARGGLVLLERILAGAAIPAQPPSFEELLDEAAYPDPAHQDEVLGWWSRRVTERVRALDLAAIARLLPATAPARLTLATLDGPAFGRLQERCRNEETTLHGAVVAALVPEAGAGRLGHAVDMRRFLPEPLAGETWFALSSLVTPTPDAAGYWERARQARALVSAGLAAGEAGAALAELPRTLAAETRRSMARPPLTVSNGGRATLPSGPHGQATWYMALAGANAGGPVLSVSGAGERLMLASVVPDDQADLPVQAIARRLHEAASA